MKFDLTTVYNEDRPLSWSGISSFEWNPRQWYDKYVLKQEQVMTPELILGKEIDMKVQEDSKFLKQLPRYPIMQHKMKCTWNAIPLIGYSDQYRPMIFKKLKKVKGVFHNISEPLAIRDLKTGRKAWDQKRADETGQLTMYLFMLYLMDKSIDVSKAELYIDWLPTHIKDGKLVLVEPIVVQTFKTKRSMVEVLKFAQRIENTWKLMEEYATHRQAIETKVVHSFKDW